MLSGDSARYFYFDLSVSDSFYFSVTPGHDLGVPFSKLLGERNSPSSRHKARRLTTQKELTIQKELSAEVVREYVPGACHCGFVGGHGLPAVP